MQNPKRSQTVSALQALSLLNNQFVLEQAQHFSERIAAADSAEPIALAYRLAMLPSQPTANGGLPSSSSASMVWPPFAGCCSIPTSFSTSIDGSRQRGTHSMHRLSKVVTRRDFLRTAGGGLGMLALSDLLLADRPRRPRAGRITSRPPARADVAHVGRSEPRRFVRLQAGPGQNAGQPITRRNVSDVFFRTRES